MIYATQTDLLQLASKANITHFLNPHRRCYGRTVTQTKDIRPELDTALIELLSRMNIPVLLLAFMLAMIIRAAVGSATVAMLTAVAIVGPSAVEMGYSPIIIGLAICTGTVGLTLPTDAAFWLPARYSREIGRASCRERV